MTSPNLAGLIESIDTALSRAQLLHQNSVGCAVQHHGHDCELHGLPGWLAEAQERIAEGRAALAALRTVSDEPGAGWRSMESAPKDRVIWVYAPGVQELEPIICLCHWHKDGGFCVDELRVPTLWQPLAAVPAAPEPAMPDTQSREGEKP